MLLTHRNLLANLLPLETEIAKYIKWGRFFHPIRFLNLVPLSHVFGQFMGIFVPQLLGGEVHFHDSLNPAEVVRRTRASRISVIILVPRMLDSLREWVERTYALVPRIGRDKVRDIIVNDSLGICAQLDIEVEKTIAAYVDPWLERDQPAYAGQFDEAKRIPLPLV